VKSAIRNRKLLLVTKLQFSNPLSEKLWLFGKISSGYYRETGAWESVGDEPGNPVVNWSLGIRETVLFQIDKFRWKWFSGDKYKISVNAATQTTLPQPCRGGHVIKNFSPAANCHFQQERNEWR
jgi:hypothetical protein